MVDRAKGPFLAASVLVAGTLALCPVAASATEANARDNIAGGVVLEVGEDEGAVASEESDVILPSEPAIADAETSVPASQAPTEYDGEAPLRGETPADGELAVPADEAEPSDEAEVGIADALVGSDPELDQDQDQDGAIEEEAPEPAVDDELSLGAVQPEPVEPSLGSEDADAVEVADDDESQAVQADPLSQGNRDGAGASGEQDAPKDEEEATPEPQVKAEADVEPHAELETSDETEAKKDSDKGDSEAEEAEEKVETIELYRLYNPYTGEHLFSTSASERDSLVPLGWKYEGVAWVSPKTSDKAVYRLFNPYAPGGDHHYTTNKEEYDALCALGWRGEELAWYSADDDGAQLFRFFNPYASSSTHHYTSDAAERLSLVSLGWLYEGVAWFGVDTGPVAPSTSETGWVESEGARFYGNGDGTYVTGWKTIDGTTYHFDKKGRLSTGVTDVDGTLHYFGEDGKIKTGWQKLSDFTYYFESDGTTRRCGWWDTEGKRVYLDTVSGAMAIGWKDIDGGRYYFEGSGNLYRGGWLTLGGATYYLDPSSGLMATGKRTIDGVIRNFRSDGMCTKTGYQVNWKGLSLSSENVTLPSYANGSYWSYVHPTIISADATREECIEAFISVAYEYMRAGTRWVDNNCGRPGTTVDCSGLVMEALYACGMDLTGAAGGDYNPYSKYYWNHSFANTWRNNQTFQPVSLSQIERGDIIYYNGHVAIYLGNGQIIESTILASNVRVGSMYAPGTILGAARPFTK